VFVRQQQQQQQHKDEGACRVDDKISFTSRNVTQGSESGAYIQTHTHAQKRLLLSMKISEKRSRMKRNNQKLNESTLLCVCVCVLLCVSAILCKLHDLSVRRKLFSFSFFLLARSFRSLREPISTLCTKVSTAFRVVTHISLLYMLARQSLGNQTWTHKAEQSEGMYSKAVQPQFVLISSERLLLCQKESSE